MTAAKLVTIEVYRAGFQVGPELTARVDLHDPDSTAQLDELLRAAAERDRSPVSDYHLRVLDGDTVVIQQFVTTEESEA